MAQQSQSASNRPLSPHLQIWRWTWAMRVSILHRITGSGLAFAGLGVLLWWLGALASGPAAYDTFSRVMTTPLGWIVLVGISWSFFHHMASGIRHFVLDIGAGFELSRNTLWSILTPVAGILLTAAFWALMLLR